MYRVWAKRVVGGGLPLGLAGRCRGQQCRQDISTQEIWDRAKRGPQAHIHLKEERLPLLGEGKILLPDQLVQEDLIHCTL